MSQVAIIRRNGFGDLLCTYPLVLYFKKYFPSTRITLFVDERNAPLLPYLPHIDEAVILPASGNKYFQLARIALRYRKKQFDVAISGKTSPMKLVDCFLFALGAKRRIAPVATGWHRHLINEPIFFDEKGGKSVHQALKTLRTVNPNCQEVPEELFPRIHMHCTPMPHALSAPLLLLSASTTRCASRLDPIRYSHIVNRVYEKTAFSVVLMGQERDRERARAIADKLHPPTIVTFPKTFDDCIRWISTSNYCFIGDGGVAHLAAALDKPQLVLFGETHPAEWGPLSHKARTVYDSIHVDRLDEGVLEETLTQIILQDDVHCR